MCEGNYDRMLSQMNREAERYGIRGRRIEAQDGSGDQILTEGDNKKNIGRETRITTSGEIIFETKINRETYNWTLEGVKK